MLKPTTDNNYLGIEIEFVSRKPIKTVKRMINGLKLARYCEPTTDGSIRAGTLQTVSVEQWDGSYRDVGQWVNSPYFFGIELRVLCKQSELADVMKGVDKLLKKCRAEVNNSCGLHVHLDMRNRDSIRCAKLLLERERELFKLVAPNRRDNGYCYSSSVNVKDLDLFTSLEGLVKYDDDLERHTSINLLAYKKHKTIEVRLHEGTIDTQEIVNWCRYLTHIVDRRKPGKRIKTYAKKRIKECRAQAS